jgi:hypothetical protein
VLPLLPAAALGIGLLASGCAIDLDELAADLERPAVKRYGNDSPLCAAAHNGESINCGRPWLGSSRPHCSTGRARKGLSPVRQTTTVESKQS